MGTILKAAHPHIGLQQPVIAQPACVFPVIFQDFLEGLQLCIRVVRMVQGHSLHQGRELGGTEFVFPVVGQDAVLYL